MIFNRLKKKSASTTPERGAQKFILEHVNVSEMVYTRKSILLSPPDADVLITGSDQVWNKLDGTYFLDFCKDSQTRKVAYAASFGGRSYHGIDARIVRKWLSSFHAVSLRERNGVEQCNRLEIHSAQLVPDPTLLLTKDDYNKLCNDTVNEKYVLIYLLGSKMDFDVSAVYSFAYSKGLKVVYVASQGMTDSYDKVYPSISEWLTLISNAEYIVTNSFHGTVFSLIFERQFLTIPLTGGASKMNCRLETLLEDFNLSDRLTNDLNKFDSEINYKIRLQTFNELRNRGYEFLKNAIGNE